MHHPLAQETDNLMEMENSHHHHEEEKMIRLLYEASHKGCISTLRTLIQQQPLVLQRINSRTTFMDTPLNISATIGHLEFSKALLAHKPKLALELDSFRSTALHVASAEGHIHNVKELLAAYDQACLVSDHEDRIPLHVAVIRGRLEVVIELIRAKPESLKILHKGKTVLHLCVTYNHLKILKSLVDSNFEICDELFNWRDLNGNTIFHLAIMFKQVETVRYLVSIPKIREASILKNKLGFTANDIADDGMPKDLKSREIQVIVMNSFKSDKKEETDIIPQAAAGTSDAVEEGAVKPLKKKWYNWRNMAKYMGKWFKHNGEKLEEMRGNLSLVATVITTMTFQCVMNPPGGFIQQGISNYSNGAPNNPNTTSSSPLDCLEMGEAYACPGKAMLASNDPDHFRSFIMHNTVAFETSIGITMLLISGLPLKNKVVMWVLSIGMCITLSEIGFAYFTALYMMSPDKLWHSTNKMLRIVDWIWLSLFALVAGYILLAFLIWLVKKCSGITKPVRMLTYCGRNRSYGNGCCRI
ncbi:hypothetical protein K1719_047269 [Acacia pycnantha]|nr:hypothetical protein K1719_047269 [Acacia pycnantha]